MNGTSISIYKGVMLRNEKKMNRTMKTTGKARKKSNSGPKWGGKGLPLGGLEPPFPVPETDAFSIRPQGRSYVMTPESLYSL